MRPSRVCSLGVGGMFVCMCVCVLGGGGGAGCVLVVRFRLRTAWCLPRALWLCQLTGIPVKIKRRNAVVKQMFHNPEDVKVRGSGLGCLLDGEGLCGAHPVSPLAWVGVGLLLLRPATVV
jgi:hypothetical protein